MKNLIKTTLLATAIASSMNLGFATKKTLPIAKDPDPQDFLKEIKPVLITEKIIKTEFKNMPKQEKNYLLEAFKQNKRGVMGFPFDGNNDGTNEWFIIYKYVDSPTYLYYGELIYQPKLKLVGNMRGYHSESMFDEKPQYTRFWLMKQKQNGYYSFFITNERPEHYKIPYNDRSSSLSPKLHGVQFDFRGVDKGDDLGSPEFNANERNKPEYIEQMLGACNRDGFCWGHHTFDYSLIKE